MKELYYEKVTNIYATSKPFSIQTSIRPPKTIRTSMITLTKSGRLSLRTRYNWNGITKFIEVIFMRKATVVHDPLYTLIDRGLLDESWRDEADMEFMRISLETIDNLVKTKKMWRIPFRARLARRAVKAGYKLLRKLDGKLAVKPNEVLIAP